jgi:hypothetical protein
MHSRGSPSISHRARQYHYPVATDCNIHGSPHESPMRSPQPSIHASSCGAPSNACARSLCSTLDPSVHDTFARSVSVQTHPAGGHRGGVAAHCQMGLWYRLQCVAQRSISRFCAALRGTARSYLRMTTCGSHYACCASSIYYKQIRVEVINFCFSCPHLKFISTTLGSILPSTNSHVGVGALYKVMDL